MALATLSIDLIARLASLQTGMDKATRLVEKSTADMEKRWAAMGAAAKAAGAAIGAAFSITGLGAFVKAQADAIDALNDVKDATGASIENISALDDIARRTGATLEGDVAPALSKFNMLLKEADGKNAASQILKDIGLSAKTLRELDPAEALLEVSKALQQYDDDGQKARVMQELFGKSAGQLAPFLKDLAEAGELVATTTTAQAQAAEDFNKKLADLSTEVNAIGRSVATGLIPELTLLLKTMTDGMKGAGDYRVAVAAIVEPLQAAVRIASGAAFAIERYGRAWGVLLAAGMEFGSGNLGAARAIIAGFKEENEQALAAFSDFQRKVSEGISEAPVDPNAAREDRGFTPTIPGRRLGDVPGTVKDPKKAKEPGGGFVGPELPAGLQAEVDAVNQALKSLDSTKVSELQAQLRALLQAEGVSDDPRIAEAILRTKQELAELDPLQAQARKQQERLNELLAATPSAELEKTRADMQLLAKALEAGTITATQFNEAATAALGLIDEDAKKAKDAVTEFAKEASKVVQQELSGLLEDVLRGDFESIGKDWENLLIQMAAQAAAAKLNEALFGEAVGGQGSGLLGDLIKIGADYFTSGGTGGGTGTATGTGTGGMGVDYSLPTSGGLGKAEAAGIASKQSAGSGKVTINMHGSAQAIERSESSTNPDGTQNIDVFFRQVDNRMAQGLASGTSRTAKAMEGTYGVRRSTARLGR